MVKTVVKSKHLLAFKLWFLNMNYVVNDLADGGFTAKIKAKEFKKGHRYVLVSGDATGNKAAYELGKEFEEHLKVA